MQESVPPQNIEAELSVLNAILIDNNVIDKLYDVCGSCITLLINIVPTSANALYHAYNMVNNILLKAASDFTKTKKIRKKCI